MGIGGIYRIILSVLLLGFSCCAIGYATPVNSDPCKTCNYAGKTCNSNTADFAIPIASESFFVLGIIGLATFYFWKQYKKKSYLIMGMAAGLAVGGSFLYAGINRKTSEAVVESKWAVTAPNQVLDEEFKPATDEFVSVSSDEFTAENNTERLDEFSPASSEFSEDIPVNADNSVNDAFEVGLLVQVLALFMLIVIIALTIKYGIVRKARPFLLLGSVIYLGFVKGGCPCMIMSMHNTVLFVLGNKVAWISMLWFVGLIPLTYFFGKIWCGWLCHLGGLQDYLYRITGWHLLKSSKAQKVLKYIQISLFIVLLVQLFITRSNLYIHYDPFKVAFNLVSATITGYVLLVLLLISSVLIYRPFCRIVCPVGLILGWITCIPGSRKLKVKETTCSGCRACTRHCKMYALKGGLTAVLINSQDCILCGECIGSCKRHALSVTVKK